MALVSLGLLAALPRPAPAALDLWLSSVSYDTTHVGGNVVVTVEVKKQGTAPVSGAISQLKRNNNVVRTFHVLGPDSAVLPAYPDRQRQRRVRSVRRPRQPDIGASVTAGARATRSVTRLRRAGRTRCSCSG